MFVKGIKENFDLWSIVHFLGPFFLCYVIGPVWATVALVGWEVMDLLFAIYYNSGWRLRHLWLDLPTYILDKIFDRRGASWGDLILGFISISLWFVCHNRIIWIQIADGLKLFT